MKLIEVAPHSASIKLFLKGFLIVEQGEMSEILLIKLTVAGLVISALLYFLARFRYGQEHLTFKSKIATAASGFAANFFDTFGIGSFATLFALRNLFKLMPDHKRYNGSLVIQAMLTTLVQSTMFLQLVSIDVTTVAVSSCLIALGGFVSGFLIRYVTRNFIYSVMLTVFIGTLLILVLDHLSLLTVGGYLLQVRGMKLVILSLVMFIAGCLPAFGVGYYSVVLSVIFLLGLSPAVAYPIMTTASAIQMPMTAIPMIKTRQFYSLSALLMAIPGCVAVFFAVPIIAHVNMLYLRWILLIILAYNVIILLRAKRGLKAASLKPAA